MDKQELIQKIIQKKEFSQLPKKDVELAFEKFDKEIYCGEEKVKLTRDLLRKVFSVFGSQKLLNLKNKDAGWFLKKHISTRERFDFYGELYKKILGEFEGEITIFDLGCGVNGFSYKNFSKIGIGQTRRFINPASSPLPPSREEVRKNKSPRFSEVNYLGVEAMGQLVDLMNYHFKTRGIEHCHALHLSLFDLEKLKKYILQVKGAKVVFLFKVLDSLEMLKRDYSKKLLLELVPLVDKVVVSFATRSLVKRKKFNVNRSWILEFIKEEFKMLDDFELGGEKYVVFCKR